MCCFLLKADFLEELALLKNVFVSTGNPERLVVKTLEASWVTEALKVVLLGIQQEVKVEGRKDYFEVLHAPHMRDFSVITTCFSFGILLEIFMF